MLGTPEIGQVRQLNGGQPEPGIPDYLVRPSSYSSVIRSLPELVKIVDYGESFLDNDTPETLSTPLCFRAPEVVLGDEFDPRVDIWSMGCLVGSLCLYNFN